MPVPEVNVTFWMFVHPLNAGEVLDVTEFRLNGKVRSFSSVHPWNAPSPMDDTESGMMRDVREVHPWNALSPMDVTESGMITEVREVHM